MAWKRNHEIGELNIVCSRNPHWNTIFSKIDPSPELECHLYVICIIPIHTNMQSGFLGLYQEKQIFY